MIAKAKYKIILAAWLILMGYAPLQSYGAVLTPITPRTLNWWMTYGESFVSIHVAGYLACMDTRIPHSLCLPDMDTETLNSLLPSKKDTKIVIYGGYTPLDSRHPLLSQLEQLGYHNLYLLQGGLPAWKMAGYETESPARISRVPVPSISAARVEDWKKQAERPFILDTRDAALFQERHIDGAMNIPLTDLHRRYQDIPLGRSLLIVDADGSQSLLVSSYLARKGFHNIRWLRGGTKAWEREVLWQPR